MSARLLLISSVALAAALLNQQMAFRAADQRADSLGLLVAQRVIPERMLGGMLPPELVGIISLSNERPTVIWILDADECHECMGELAPWNQLSSSPAVDGLLILDGPELDAEIPRLHESTEVIHRSLGDVETFRGYHLRSLKMVVAPSGEVIAVDARVPDGMCRWNFEAQVERLLGLNLEIPFQRSGAPSGGTP